MKTALALVLFFAATALSGQVNKQFVRYYEEWTIYGIDQFTEVRFVNEGSVPVFGKVNGEDLDGGSGSHAGFFGNWIEAELLLGPGESSPIYTEYLFNRPWFAAGERAWRTYNWMVATAPGQSGVLTLNRQVGDVVSPYNDAVNYGNAAGWNNGWTSGREEETFVNPGGQDVATGSATLSQEGTWTYVLRIGYEDYYGNETGVTTVTVFYNVVPVGLGPLRLTLEGPTSIRSQ